MQIQFTLNLDHILAPPKNSMQDKFIFLPKEGVVQIDSIHTNQGITYYSYLLQHLWLPKEISNQRIVRFIEISKQASINTCIIPWLFQSEFTV